MGACHANQPQPVIKQDPRFNEYSQLLTSIRNKHAEFNFSIRQIVYKKDENILFQVQNMIDQRYHYLQQIQIKTNDEIEMMLRQIQLSIEKTDGFLLNYQTSFASRRGNCVFIVYEYVELISLESIITDQKQGQRMLINQETYSQLFGIFYLLNKFQLSIYNLDIENIFIHKKQGKIDIKLINITFIKKYQCVQDSFFWKLEQYEIETLIDILVQLNKRNIKKQDQCQLLDATINDLTNGKCELKDVFQNLKDYQKQCKFREIQKIKMAEQVKENLNLFLFQLNLWIQNQTIYQATPQYDQTSEINQLNIIMKI